MSSGVVIVKVPIDSTDEEILEMMRRMKLAREAPAVQNIICLIGGFDKDPRKLYEISEVCALCRRLVSTGFISYLDLWTSSRRVEPALRMGWGAAEVWLCGEGRLGPMLRLTKGILDELVTVVEDANERASAALGPLE